MGIHSGGWDLLEWLVGRWYGNQWPLVLSLMRPVTGGMFGGHSVVLVGQFELRQSISSG